MLRAGRSGVWTSVILRGFFLVFENARLDCEAPFNAHRPFIPGVILLWPDADHLLPSSAEVRNEWSYASSTPISSRLGRGQVFSLLLMPFYTYKTYIINYCMLIFRYLIVFWREYLEVAGNVWQGFGYNCVIHYMDSHFWGVWNLR